MAAVLVIPVFIPHQGCPHHCSFCNQNLITRQHDARRPGLPDAPALDRIITEYRAWKKDRKEVELAFFGGNFLGLPQQEIRQLLGFVQPYIDKGLIHSVRCSTRPDTVTKPVLDLVKPLGLTLVELGVQSMDDRVLAASGRGHTRDHTLRAMERLRAAGMGIGVQLMAGLPGDSARGAAETAAAIAAAKPDLARIYPVLVLAGSRLARDYQNGQYQPLGLEEAVDQVKTMAIILEGAGVPVVRMGLQASDAMADDLCVLAGPWHPAFGHLVRSAMMLDRVCEQADQIFGHEKPGDTAELILTVHPRSDSRLRGDKNANLTTLARRYPGSRVVIETDDGLDLQGVGVRVRP